MVAVCQAVARTKTIRPKKFEKKVAAGKIIINHEDYVNLKPYAIIL